MRPRGPHPEQDPPMPLVQPPEVIPTAASAQAQEPLRPDGRLVDLHCFYAMDVHVAPVEALPGIRERGVEADTDGRSYWWSEGLVDPQGMGEVLQAKGADPADTVILGVPAGELPGESDPAMWNGASEAFATQGGVSPDRLFLWSEVANRWERLVP